MASTKSKFRPKSDISIVEKFQDAREAMKSALIERDDEIDLCLTAMICGENPLFVGPPGTAKSLMGDSLMRWADMSKFSILLTKFTTPEEVVGPISVMGLKEDVYRRVTKGKLVEAEFAFTDEVFKANSAILNTFLRILNERVFENGDGVFRKCPLLLCIGASNEWPDPENGGKELGALFDRFLFRKKVRSIATRGGRTRLLWDENLVPEFRTSITSEEIRHAGKEAMRIDFSDTSIEAFEAILDTLNKEGIHPGDRRMRKSVSAVKAFTYLNGAKVVAPEHLEVLAHTLWDDPIEQPEKTAKVVMKVANPTGMIVGDILVRVEDVIAKNLPEAAVEKLKALREELRKLPTNERVESALVYVKDQIDSSLRKTLEC